ncbi:hypothetical protein LTR66_010737, partial [Elasticomyces elasticus]
MSTNEITLNWSSRYTVASSSRALSGDKILLPPSALEQLLSAVSTTSHEPDPPQSYYPLHDPFNPYSYVAQRQAQAQWQDRQQQLPHPLTFRLVNPQNGHVVYAGIREFSADEGEIVLSSFLTEALGLSTTEPDGVSKKERAVDGAGGQKTGATDYAADGERQQIMVHAKQLPKGTFVKLRPLEAGYDAEDWKALLEQHLRNNFATLTNKEVLVVPGGRGLGKKSEEFRFLVDGFVPGTDGICIVDTDLEVDIEALNEEQARETLKRIAAKLQKAPGTDAGSSTGGELDLFDEQLGQVLPGEYVDYQLSSWSRAQGIEFELSALGEDEDVDLLVSPYSPRQRARPREDEYVFADFGSRPAKRIRLEPTNVELEEAEALWVTVHAYTNDENASTTTSAVNGTATAAAPRHYTIRARVVEPQHSAVSPVQEDTLADIPPNPDEVRCKNCNQWIPQRTLFLHENFCLRNNALCPQGCGQVFQRRSPTFAAHWHCPHDTFYGNTELSHRKHDHLDHPAEPLTCPSCDTSQTFSSMPLLAHHRTTVCPGKSILCRFCHLVVPQEGDPDIPNPEALLSGLTPHELADGARTTECHLCSKIVRLRDMHTHLKHHEFERLSRAVPRLCRNTVCGRTLDGVGKNGDTRAGTRMGQGPGNDLGLCSTCYGPLYISMYDPEGRALKRRVERRYLQQLVSGCGKSWCRNPYCRTGRTNSGTGDGAVSTKEALPMVKPFLERLNGGDAPLHFCVDEGSQRRRGVAEMMA